MDRFLRSTEVRNPLLITALPPSVTWWSGIECGVTLAVEKEERETGEGKSGRRERMDRVRVYFRKELDMKYQKQKSHIHPSREITNISSSIHTWPTWYIYSNDTTHFHNQHQRSLNPTYCTHHLHNPPTPHLSLDTVAPGGGVSSYVSRVDAITSQYVCSLSIIQQYIHLWWLRLHGRCHQGSVA